MPARLRPGTDLDRLRELVALQARHVRAAVAPPGGWAATEPYRAPLRPDPVVACPSRSDPVAPPGPGPEPQPDAGVLGPGRYADVVDGLLSRLATSADEHGHSPCFRVTVIGGNPRFPLSWRREAFSTLLPAAAVEAVGRWRWWYDQLSAGRMSHHLRHLLAWHAYLDLVEAQAALTARARLTLVRTNAWAGRDELHQARQQVFALPDPPPLTRPGAPPESPADDRADHERDRVIQTLAGQVERVREVTREFNRAVPRGVRARAPEPFDPAEHPVRDEWLEEFLDWVEPFLRTGHGLYLWA